MPALTAPSYPPGTRVQPLPRATSDGLPMPRVLQRGLCALVAALALICAQPKAARADNAAAETLFRAGRAASARGDHATACTHYRESYRLEPAIGTLLNLALCEEALGKLASAWQHYEDAARALTTDDERLGWTKQRLAALDGRVPRLTLLVSPAAPPNTRVTVSSIELQSASFGKAVRLDPGSHEISVAAPERAASRYTVELAESERKVMTVKVGRRLAPAQKPKPRVHPPESARHSTPDRPPMSKESPRWQAIVGYSSLGVGGLALLTSGAAMMVAFDRKATVDEHCDGERKCDDTGLAAGDSGESWLNVAAVGLAVGIAATATGLYLLWTRPNTTTGVSLLPGPGPNSGRLSLHGTF
jgi:hypothetical protein